MTGLTVDGWEEYLGHHPDAHLMQSVEWGKLKSGFGWKTQYLVNEDCGAQILFKRLPFGFHIAYIPKGPVGSNFGSLLPELDRLCNQNRTIFALIEPDLFEPIQMEDMQAQLEQFGKPVEPIQPRRTLLIDLQKSEADIFGQFSQKTRYNIRLSSKKEIIVIQANDTTNFYRLMKTTGLRDGFGIHSLEYYRDVFRLFSGTNRCVLLEANYHGQTIAAMMAFFHGQRAWYLYGASSDIERNRMPTYLLQWEAIRWAKAHGCKTYDLWGVPDADANALESGFTHRSDGLWGVYRFKRGFNGQLVRSVGAWARIYNPVLYQLYRMVRQGNGAAS